MSQPPPSTPPDAAQLAAALQKLGIRQDGDPILRQVARPFLLPTEAAQARTLARTLIERIQQIKTLHPFSKGIGLAAPQIGDPRALAIVQTTDGQQLTLINPTVLTISTDQDTQFEGCLSFFDVRGQVPRPLHIRLAVTDLDGTRQELALDHGTARLALHEVDHLYGRLYKDRMPPDARLVPLAEYRQAGTTWQY